MFKSSSYLASASLLVMMAMVQPGQAMLEEDEMYDGEAKAALYDGFYYDGEDFKEVNPEIGCITRISTDTLNRFRDNIDEKKKRLLSLEKEVGSGKYNDLTGEFISLFIAELAGEAEKSLFGKLQTEIDTDTLVKASKEIVNRFFKHLSKNNDFYGETEDGKRVTIYNRSLFKMFADKCFPKVPVVTDLSIALLDNDHVKNYMRDKLLETVFNRLKGSLQTQGITLKAKLGQEAVDSAKSLLSFGHSMIYDESTVDYAAIWNYVSPHLNYKMRDFMLSLLTETQNSLIKKAEPYVYKVVPVIAVASGYAGYLVGSTVSALFNDEPLIQAAGYCLTAAAGVAGGILADSGFQATKTYASKQLNHKLTSLAHQLVPYTRDEHALYHLNPTPTVVEIGLAWDDYMRRDELNSQSFVKKLLEGMGETTGINRIMASIFGEEDESLPPLPIKYCMFEEQEQALRRLTLLNEQDPEAAAEIIRNRKQYPSFEEKEKFLKHIGAVSVETVKEEKARVKRYAAFREEKVRKIQAFAGKLTQAINAHQDLGELKQDLVKAIVQEIQNSSIESQDFIVKWAEKHDDTLAQLVQEFAARNGFVKEGIGPFFDIDGDAEVEDSSPILNTKAVKTFVTSLTEIHVKDYIAKLDEEYKKKHPDALERLLRDPITERMDLPQVIRLHKQLIKAEEKKSPFEKLVSSELGITLAEHLDDKDLALYGDRSPGLYKWACDALDSRKIARMPQVFDLSKAEDLKDYFNKHRSDILLIQETYEELKCNHTAFTLIEILRNHLREMGVFEQVIAQIKTERETGAYRKIKKQIMEKFGEKIKARLKKELGREPTEREFEFECLVNHVANSLAVHKAYSPVNEMLRGHRKDPAVDKVFGKERARLARAIAKDILGQKQDDDSVKEWLHAPRSKPAQGWGLVSWNSGSSIPVLTQTSVDATVKAAQKALVPHDVSPRGVRGHSLSCALNRMEIEDHSALELRDFVGIHQKIFADKLTKANDSDIEFMNKYGDVVFELKSMTPLYRHKLFYSLEELVQTIRSQNREFVKCLFSLSDKR